MLKHVTIEGYRQFSRLELRDLTRVTLFVGRNNSGKTTVLDALELASWRPDQEAVMRSSQRRDEFVYQSTDDLTEMLLQARSRSSRVDVRQLFFGRQPEEDASFSIDAFDSVGVQHVTRVKFKSGITRGPDNGAEGRVRVEANGRLEILYDGQRSDSQVAETSQERGGVVESQETQSASPKIYFVGTDKMSDRAMSNLWDSVALTPEEDEAIQATKLIDDSIERVAFIGFEASRRSPRPFFKQKGSEVRLPIGSMGDGVRKLFQLALALPVARNGALFVDEIDTGLHYSALTKMWRMVIVTAERLHLQVFATTHSVDCLRALRNAIADAPELADEISVHRLERNNPKSVRYSAQELDAAMESEMEIR